MNPIYQFLRKRVKSARDLKLRRKGLVYLSRCRKKGFPEKIHAPVQHLIQGSVPSEFRPVHEKIEKIRAAVAALPDESITVIYSPEPGSVETAEDGSVRPVPGQPRPFKPADLAMKTSLPAHAGVLLHALGSAIGAKHILELGSCVGIGSSYLGSIRSCERFVTIEASKELAAVAKSSVDQVCDCAEVVNDYFDNALDRLLPEWEGGIDLAWIDGHHEKQATLHYFERIIPYLNKGALVVFDDIYWSRDMTEGWLEIARREGVSHSVDLNLCGVCIWDGERVRPSVWNFSPWLNAGYTTPWMPEGWIKKPSERAQVSRSFAPPVISPASRVFRGVVPWEKTRALFMLSTGRTGTESLYEILRNASSVDAFHEPEPRLIPERCEAFHYAHELPVRFGDVFRDARSTAIGRSLVKGRVYAETSARMTFFVPVIAEMMPQARFLFVHRDPTEVIRSGMRRGWYQSHISDQFRISPGPADPVFSAWDSWSAFEKICWYWAAYNEFSLNAVSGISADRVLTVPFAELFDPSMKRIEELFTFIGIKPVPSEVIARQLQQPCNVQTENDFPRFDDWSAEQKSALYRIAGSVMSRLGYPVSEVEEG